MMPSNSHWIKTAALTLAADITAQGGEPARIKGLSAAALVFAGLVTGEPLSDAESLELLREVKAARIPASGWLELPEQRAAVRVSLEGEQARPVAIKLRRDEWNGYGARAEEALLDLGWLSGELHGEWRETTDGGWMMCDLRTADLCRVDQQ
jgi:hypothetical protein